jgi:hypothetical protein
VLLAPGPGASRVSLNVWPSGPMAVWPLLPVTPDNGVRPDSGATPRSTDCAGPGVAALGGTVPAGRPDGSPPAAAPEFVAALAPPAQPAEAAPRTAAASPHTWPGTLTGMVTWLPLPMDTDPLVPLPPAPWDAPTEARAPPWHPAAAMPSRAPALPQTATGGLTGASRPLPPSTATAPGLLLAVPAQATLDRAPPAAAKPTATSAVFAVQCAHGRMGTPCET